jgi:hypothetical protein
MLSHICILTFIDAPNRSRFIHVTRLAFQYRLFQRNALPSDPMRAFFQVCHSALSWRWLLCFIISSSHSVTNFHPFPQHHVNEEQRASANNKDWLCVARRA